MISFEQFVKDLAGQLEYDLVLRVTADARIEQSADGKEFGIICFDDPTENNSYWIEIHKVNPSMSEAQKADQEARLSASDPTDIDLESNPAPSDALRNGDC